MSSLTLKKIAGFSGRDGPIVLIIMFSSRVMWRSRNLLIWSAASRAVSVFSVSFMTFVDARGVPSICSFVRVSAHLGSRLFNPMGAPYSLDDRDADERLGGILHVPTSSFADYRYMSQNVLGQYLCRHLPWLWQFFLRQLESTGDDKLLS